MMSDRQLEIGLTSEIARGTHRNPDHHTSIEAGVRNLGRRGCQRALLARQFYDVFPAGLTDEAAALRAHIPPQSSPWKRCTELRDRGFLEYTDVDQPTSTGSMAKVWRLTGLGHRAVKAMLDNQP